MSFVAPLLIGILAWIAWRLGAVTGSGAWAGIGVAGCVWAGFGGWGLLWLGAFVVLGTVTARLPGWRSHRQGRAARHVLANGAVPALLGAIAWTASPANDWPVVATLGALAAAAGDTVAGEIGMRWGGPPRLLITAKPVRPGEDGGVTLLGTLAGVGASAFLALLGVLGGVGAFGAVWAGGVVGNLVDSVLGATLERRSVLGNGAVNLLATLTGALFAALLAAVAR